MRTGQLPACGARACEDKENTDGSDHSAQACVRARGTHTGRPRPTAHQCVRVGDVCSV